MTRLRWRLLPIASRVLPEWALRFLHRRWPVGYDPSDGWSFWLDASYARWVRRDMAARR